MLPSFITNYMLGCATNCSFGAYVVGSFGLIVKVGLHTFIGCGIYQATKTKDYDSKLEDALVLVEMLFSIMLTVIISFLARRYLDKRLADKEQKELVADVELK